MNCPFTKSGYSITDRRCSVSGVETLLRSGVILLVARFSIDIDEGLDGVTMLGRGVGSILP